MLDVAHIIQSGGLIFLGLFLFAEVGLLLGFFLPGDTLLITAGIYAMEGKFAIWAVILVAAVAAILGDNTAYFIGHKLGHKVFRKKDSLIFDPGHIQRAEKYFEKYGSKTVLLAHFVPVIRTFSPLLGGIGKMSYSKFLIFDAIGDITWAVVVSLLGYYVGSRIPGIDHYILFVVGLVIIFSLSPTIIQLIRRLLKRRRSET